MTMKAIIIIFGILYSSLLYSQTGAYVSYGYVGGNRTNRIIVFPPTPPGTNARLTSDTTAQDTTAITQLTETGKIYIEVFEKRNISIYPNPTKGVLAVEISNAGDINNISLQLYDLQGKQIYNEANFKGKSEINFINSPAGAYALKIIIEGKEIVWNIIKQ